MQQFLYDDYIKSKLVREARMHREHAAALREQLRNGNGAGAPNAWASQKAGGGAPPSPAVAQGSAYPYEHAERLHRDVRKLGEARADVTVRRRHSLLTTPCCHSLSPPRGMPRGRCSTPSAF